MQENLVNPIQLQTLRRFLDTLSAQTDTLIQVLVPNTNKNDNND
jgi:hypothetical protein